ncbi:hypothetical protein F4806DRAFT_506836 [Annulohypoxylon nitens]|nr:hypothetical protein F4806DRAFT_506836 [Annulohypoxylon nitens]
MSPPRHSAMLPNTLPKSEPQSFAAKTLAKEEKIGVGSSKPRRPLPGPPSSRAPQGHNRPCRGTQLNHQHPQPQKKLSNKTLKERARGAALLKDGVGEKARVPCAHCLKNPDGCRVPSSSHVKEYNSLKCAKCISQKLSCSFNIDNPGIEYPREVLSGIKKNEMNKRAAREKAKKTNYTKHEARLGEHEKSNTSSSSTSASASSSSSPPLLPPLPSPHTLPSAPAAPPQAPPPPALPSNHLPSTTTTTSSNTSTSTSANTSTNNSTNTSTNMSTNTTSTTTTTTTIPAIIPPPIIITPLTTIPPSSAATHNFTLLTDAILKRLADRSRWKEPPYEEIMGRLPPEDWREKLRKGKQIGKK